MPSSITYSCLVVCLSIGRFVHDCYPSLLSIAVVDTMTTATLRGKSLFHRLLTAHCEGKSGQELKVGLVAGTEAEAMEEQRVLVCISWLAQLAFFLNQWWRCLQWPGPFGLGPSTSITNQENAPMDMTDYNLMVAIPHP